MKRSLTISLLLSIIGIIKAPTVSGQDIYRNVVDLTKVSNDQLSIELFAPSIRKKEIIYYFPKIVPGTYMNSNYGKYVHDLKAFDKSGSSEISRIP